MALGRLTSGALVTALIVASPLAAVAAAQSSNGNSSDVPTVNSWALAPTGKTPSAATRTNLSYTMAPGAIIKDSVTLWNFSNVELSFKLYGTDAFNGAGGAFALLPGNKPPKDAGAWVTLTYTEATLRPRAKVDIPFTLAVPATATPGDHAGALLASSAIKGTGADGKVVDVDRRTGSRMYVRVSGPLHASLVVDSLQTTYHASVNPLSGTLDVRYTVRNAGNVRAGAHQRVSGSALFGIGKKNRKLPDLADVLPGNAVTVHARFKGVPALLRAASQVQLTPFSTTGDQPAPNVRRSGNTWAIPWSVLVVLVLLEVGRRGRRAWRRRRAG